MGGQSLGEQTRQYPCTYMWTHAGCLTKCSSEDTFLLKSGGGVVTLLRLIIPSENILDSLCSFPPFLVEGPTKDQNTSKVTFNASFNILHIHNIIAEY